MKKYKVSLSFQCNEDWNKMTQMEKGRHCDSCNKIVVDFSPLTDSQIVNYLLQNKNTCGKFNPTQLDRTYTIYQIKKRKNWPAIAAMVVAGMFSLATPPLNAAKHGNTEIKTTHGGTIIIPENPAATYKKVEPDKSKSYFTIRLVNESTNEKILYGSVYIAGMGTFYADLNGDIIIENNIEQAYFPNVLDIVANGPGYESKMYKFETKYIKQSVFAKILLIERPVDYTQPAGTVAIEEQ